MEVRLFFNIDNLMGRAVMNSRIIWLGMMGLLLGREPMIQAEQSADSRTQQVKQLYQEMAAASSDALYNDLRTQLNELLQADSRRQPQGRLDQGGEGWWDATLLPPDPSISASGTTVGYQNDFNVADLEYPPNPCWEGYFSQSLSCAGPDVAYRYTVPVEGQYRMSLCSGPLYDSGLLVYVYTGNQPSNFTDLICGNDDFCNLTSELTTPPLPAGLELLIVVDGWNASAGSYVVNIELAQLNIPPNDLCADPLFLEPWTAVTGFTTDATYDDVPDCGTSISAPGVWYVTVGTGNTMTAHTCFGADYDTKINVFSGTCDAPVCVAGNDDVCGLSSSVSWCSVAGEQYLILVQGFGGQTGSFTLMLEDDGVPCTGVDDVYTIPEVYLERDILVGQEITLLAFATPEGSLVHDFQIYTITRKQPQFHTMVLDGGISIDPFQQQGAWLELRGIVGEQLTDPVFGWDLLFTPIAITVLSPALPTLIDNWRDSVAWTPSATCDTCKFAVLISGGWQGRSAVTRGSTGGSNRADYWDDLADFYCYKRSHEWCENRTKVFYYKGARPTGHTRMNDIPAGVVDSCWEAKIKAHFTALSSQIAACKRAGKCPMVEVVVSNHGDPNNGGNQGGITMVHSANGGDTLYTGREFRQSMQQLVDSGLCNLDVEFGQCFSGIMVKEIQDSLDTKGCNVTASAATNDQNSTISNPGDGGYNYWLNAKCCALSMGRSLQEAINIANRTYDQVLRNDASASGATAQAQDAIAADPTKSPRTRARAAAAAAQARADSAESAGWVGKQTYFRSFSLPKRCKSDTIQVTPGGRIDLKFSGPARSCGNCEVLCQDTTGKWIRLSQWNWNVPGSAGYVNGQNQRRIDSGGASNGIYVVHSRSDSFNVKATSTNPPLPPALDTSPSNPETFAGFAVGWTSGNSDEFGSIVANSHTIQNTDDDGFDLTTAPKFIGSGGVENLFAEYTIPVVTYWWEDMQVYVGIVNGVAGTEIFVESPGYEHTTHNALLSGGAEEIVFGLGSPSSAGDYSLHLFASGPIELDYWGLESARSTGIPPAVSDLTILRIGDDIHLFWSAVPVAVSYIVQRSPDFGGPWSDVTTVNTPGYVHANQANAPETQVYYQVIAVGP